MRAKVNFHYHEWEWKFRLQIGDNYFRMSVDSIDKDSLERYWKNIDEWDNECWVGEMSDVSLDDNILTVDNIKMVVTDDQQIRIRKAIRD